MLVNRRQCGKHLLELSIYKQHVFITESLVILIDPQMTERTGVWKNNEQNKLLFLCES